MGSCPHEKASNTLVYDGRRKNQIRFTMKHGFGGLMVSRKLPEGMFLKKIRKCKKCDEQSTWYYRVHNPYVGMYLCNECYRDIVGEPLKFRSEK